MEYVVSFLEGIITFISPCLLPMLPIYISYFAGNNKDKDSKPLNTVVNAVGFCVGFTLVFILLGAFAGLAGGFLQKYATVVNIIGGIIVILFGLNFMGAIRLPLINQTRQWKPIQFKMNVFTSLLFGVIFSIGWTPCVGVFLGSALILAAQSGTSLQGIMMLVCFSAGLSIPFIASAVLIDRLKSTFDFIKRHYKVINIISGGFLILVGIMMATGLMNYLLSLLTF